MAQALGVPLRSPDAPGAVLTFDDGPHPEGTPAILDALKTGGAKATFFLVGERVEQYPTLVEEIVSEGHETAVHGYRHRNQMRLTPGAFASDLDRATSLIAEASGRAPTLYRPPYGVFTLPGLAAVRGRDLHPLLWSKWGRDYRSDRTPAQIAYSSTDGARAGDVILLHDADWYSAPGCHHNTATAIPTILEALARGGLPAVLPPDAAVHG
jgi:peptidoglycan/xylan/chitin deacetylase (PgdA/CDA1 family)